MSNFISYTDYDSDSDSDYDPEDYDSCYSDTETSDSEREDSEDDFEEWLQTSREELLEEILDLIRDSGYNYRVSE